MLKEKDASELRPPLFIGILIGAFSVLFLSLAYLRSESGLVHAFDTGLYLQILSNLENGRAWASSITREANFLGHHFQPILILLIPWHLLLPTSFGLIAIGWVAILLAIGIMIKMLPKEGLSSSAAASLLALAFLLHPTIASRVYYSFVPEELALPCLALAAVFLAKKELPTRKENILLALSLLLASLCKETIWITAAFCFALMAVKHRKSPALKFYASSALVFTAIFLYLYFLWMPAHSSQQQYYAESYFTNDWVNGRWGILGKLLGAGLNVFTEQSLMTFLVVLILIPLGLIFLGNLWVAAGALPTLVMILAASDDKVHALNNHYLLLALPFLTVASAIGFDKIRARLQNEKMRFYLGLLLGFIPFAIMMTNNSGFMYQAILTQPNIDLALRNASEQIKKTLGPEDRILIDGTLQPFFSDYPNVKVILGFGGNPTHLSAEDFNETTRVITRNTLEEVEDCRSLKTGSGDALAYDYESFYQYCEWLKKVPSQKQIIIPGRLIDVKIDPK